LGIFIKRIVLRGNSKEKGMLLGQNLKRSLKKLIRLIKLLIFEYYEETPEKIITQFLENTKFIDAVKKWTPNCYEELKGVAKGSKLEFEELFITQCIDELVWYKNSSNLESIDHCTALGIKNYGKYSTILAQNVDFINIFKGENVLVHNIDLETGQESYIYTVFGLIALSGINNVPLALCTNGMSLKLNHSKQGLPVVFIIKGLLEKKSLEGAVKFLNEIKHASGQNYMISNMENFRDFECSANLISEYKPQSNKKTIYHTNHPLNNDDKIKPKIELINTGGSTSVKRFDIVRRFIDREYARNPVDTVKEILSCHQGPICSHFNDAPSGTSTLSSIIYVLSKKPEVYISDGPPCSHDYERLNFFS
jgi:predicted choloylglycine hydrolase